MSPEALSPGARGSYDAIDPETASADVDLNAIIANLAAIRAGAGGTELMLVVKADGYGHGMFAVAAAARTAGVQWLGVATPGEALALREAGDAGRLLCWLYGPDTDLTTAVAAGIDVSAQSVEQLSRLVAGAALAEHPARVHLKIDTGLARNGALSSTWPELCTATAEAVETGAVELVGIWSHLAAADEPGHRSISLQVAAYSDALAVADDHGLTPQLRHLGNSAAALTLPEARFDLLRVGIAAYGVDPVPGLAALGGVELTPAMTLRSQLVNVKQVPAGSSVSYGWSWTADADTTLGLVPLGYADGIPRAASNLGEVWWRGRRVPIRGKICMDQFVVDLGPGAVAEIGDEVTVFGPGTAGEPTANEWAEWCGTIGYEIVTRVGSRVVRVPLREEGSD